MPSGGGDLSHLRPLDPNGNLYTDRVGCHRGEFEHMNVRNPQPGMTYYYEKRNRARLMARMRKGYKIVTADDPELKGAAEDPNFQGSNIEGIQAHDDVVLTKCPEQLTRQRMVQRHRTNMSELTGATEKYLAAGGADERRYNSADRPIRFKSPKHGVRDLSDPGQFTLEE